MNHVAIFSTEGIAALLSLVALEIVLGIDNIVFIAIVSEHVHGAQRTLVRRVGLALALIGRLGLLFALSWIMGLKSTLFTILEQSISGRDLVLIVGGLFLMAKATHELFERVEPPAATGPQTRKPTPANPSRVGWALVQIMVLDIVFSLDSVITAVGMAPRLEIMVVAIIIAVGVMLLFVNTISDFIGKHPSMRVLALSFLLLIGVLLVADGWGRHVSKGYVYFAMAFSLGVELINMRTHTRRAAARE